MHRRVLAIALVLLSAVSAHAQWTPQGGLLLRGTLVTMDDAFTIVDGALLIRNGKIEQVLPHDAPVPTGAIEMNSHGVIFPGLINLHGHTAYDFLPLFAVPKHYENRDQWPAGKAYDAYINNPKTLVTDPDYFDLQTEALKYAELKAIVGGATAVQGTPADRGVSTILARNVEARNFGQDKVGQRGLKIDGLFVNELVQNRTAIGKLDAWLFHLGEGIGPGNWARNEYANATYTSSKPPSGHNQAGLKNLGLVGKYLVCIHCTGLTEADFQDWKAVAGEPAKIVWSPLSNLLLYGKTTDISAAMKTGALIALGTDWSPSGSKNLLWELKIAEQVSTQQMAGALTPRELVAMVTRNPARMLHWEDKVGTIAAGMVADLVVMDAQGADPYRALLDGTEANVQLVVIDGDPIYGDDSVLSNVKQTREAVPRAPGRAKALDLKRNVPNGNQSLADIVARLNRALELDPQDLAEVLNRGREGPPAEAMKPRERMKAWLAAALAKQGKPVPADLKNASKPVTVDLVRQFIKMKFPNAVAGTPDLDPVFQVNDGIYFAGLKANIHFSASPPALNLAPIEKYVTHVPPDAGGSDVSEDWLLFRFAPSVQTCHGDATAGLSARFTPPLNPLKDAVLHAVRSPKVGVTASEQGIRLDGPTAAQIRRAARVLESKTGLVGIVKVSTNQCWDRAGFERAFPPGP